MKVELPDPIPLDMPPGRVEALTDLVRDLAGAGFHLNVLAGSLAGPAAAAPGWLGDDATAAVEQLGATAMLARRAAEAVVAAMRRLSVHGECLQEARRRVAALEQEQQEDFRAVAVRHAQVADPRLAVMTGAAEWVRPLDDLRASEEFRRRRHAAVLEEVAEDAAATARVLADSCAALGGRGAPGDPARVLAYFAAQLPGWGDRELALRGRAMAEALVAEWLHPGEQDGRARDAAALAGTAAFAEAFLLGLGEDGMRATLLLLGEGDFGAESPLARLMAAVLGAAGRTGFPDEAAAVVGAPYVDAFDPGVDPDEVVLGMAVVLAAAARGRGGLPPATVASWGRQILVREHVQAGSAVDRANPRMLTRPEVDAVPLVVELLSRGDDSGAAAGLLAEPGAWHVLLARTWDDCGLDLARLVRLAGSEDGRDGGTALRAGLEALGTGLDDGDPDGWGVVEATARAVARPLAEGLAVHWAVPAGILAAGADAETSARDADRLRGLGYLTIDAGAATAIGQAVTTWVAHQPPAVAFPFAAIDLAVVAVPAAFDAVREYGQRLDHALNGFALEAAAQRRAVRWDATVGVVSELLRGAWGVAGAFEPVAARVLDVDGSFDPGPDRGAVFRREDAAHHARAQTPVRDPAAMAAVSARAREAFDSTMRLLGQPEPPTPPDTSWSRTLLDVAAGSGPVRLDGVLEARRLAGN